MIKSVVLHNFQSHRKTILEMDKLTVLTGGSNSGKSAVLRALGGLLRNDSVGDYVSHGQKLLKVIVHMDSGIAVEWEKGGGTNQYTIVYPDGREEPFQKVGTDIPEEVAEVIGISPISMEGGQKLHINLHEQLESPFLVGREHTAGYAAKVFGEITSAAKIQAAIGEASKEVRQNNARLKIKKEDSDDLEAKLMGYIDLDNQNSILKSAEAHVAAAETARKVGSRLATLETNIVRVLERLTEADDGIKLLKGTEEVDIEKLEADAATLTRVSKISTQTGSIDDYLRAIDNNLGPLEAIEGDFTITTLEGAALLVSSLEIRNGAILSLDEKIAAQEASYNAATTKLEALDEEIKEACSELESCPSCGQGLTEGAKHFIGEEQHELKNSIHG